MEPWQEKFIEEASRRFRLPDLAQRARDRATLDIGRRYVTTFLLSPEVQDSAADEAALAATTVLHTYHAGVIVSLYEKTEDDYVLGEKTYAVLTNMDTVFFSGLMFSRWNVKKRCVAYRTDFLAESLWQVLKAVAPDLSVASDAFREGMTLIFAAGCCADPETMDDPYADLSGIE